MVASLLSVRYFVFLIPDKLVFFEAERKVHRGRERNIAVFETGSDRNYCDVRNQLPRPHSAGELLSMGKNRALEALPHSMC